MSAYRGPSISERLNDLPPYAPPVPAGVLARENGLSGLVRLDANECPFGPFPAARAALERSFEHAHRYPDLDGPLIEAIAEHVGADADRVALGNGADALIGHLSRALLAPGDEALSAWPSFPTYLSDCLSAGARPVLVPLRRGAPDLGALAERIGPRTRLVWVCSPNNPTGAAVDGEALTGFLDAVPEQTMVVLDEAYYEYAAGEGHPDGVAEHALRRPNVGVLRTFSKIYGLAALRVGYFVGPPEVTAALGRCRHYYEVSQPALAAALASLQEPDEVVRRRLATRDERERLEAELAALGVAHPRSSASFLALEVGDADSVARTLLRRGVLTRSLAPLGAPSTLRVAVGLKSESDALLAALAEALRDTGTAARKQPVSRCRPA